MEQEELLRRANEKSTLIDNEYRARMQKLVEEVDSHKAKLIADIEQELNKEQAKILKAAKHDIDELNKKAAKLKIDALEEAKARAASETSTIAAEGKNLAEGSSFHQSTGTTTIRTDISAGSSTKDRGTNSAIIATLAGETPTTASGANRH